MLPVGYKSSFPLQFNVLHILPSSKIPFAKVPLDVMISNKLTFLKKSQKKQQEQVSMNSLQHKPVHSNEAEAQDQGLLLIDEFEFPHAIY